MTRTLLLTGTPRIEPAPRLLRAGRLSASLDAGALRWLRWGEVEVLRAVLFLVRTPGWGTPAPRLSELQIVEDAAGFRVSYEAQYGEPGAGLRASIRLTGTVSAGDAAREPGGAAGALRAEARIEAEAPFPTNRTGFVVLHPLDGFAGTEVTVEQASGGVARRVIAAQISPGQPLMDLRALTHQPLPGLAVETRFEGDVFEMEDQRNWSDASFKTYNRPIALPYPYLLTPGDPVAQAVTVSIRDTRREASRGSGLRAASGGPKEAGAARAVAAVAPDGMGAGVAAAMADGQARPDGAGADAGAAVSGGGDPGAGEVPPAAVVPPRAGGQRLPGFALPLDSLAAVTAALPWAARLAELRPRWLLLRHDATIESATAGLAPLARLMAATGAGLELQAIVAASDDAGATAELAALAARLAAAGVAVARVSAFAKVDEQSFQPGEPRPPHPGEAALAGALARHFPAAQRIGGSPAFFTEFNRKRPDPALWQGLTFATTPVVHMADDASVMETLQSLPHLLASALALAGGLPLSLGPTGIGARLNPYGPAPTDNAPDAREGMAARDPRQRGLMAAAWTLGYLARIAPFAPERVAFGAATGPFGLLSTPQGWARALWDGLPEGLPYPLFHVARWLSRAAGAELLRADTGGGLAELAWREPAGPVRLLANLTPAPLALPAGLGGRAVLLDVAALGDGSGGPRALPAGEGPAQLDAYALLHLSEGGAPA